MAYNIKTCVDYVVVRNILGWAQTYLIHHEGEGFDESLLIS